MAEFMGLNLKDDNPPDSDSPDTSNAFFHNGKYGILGARLGKTEYNHVAGNQRISGIFFFKGPWGNKPIISTHDGWIWDGFTVGGRGNYPVGPRATALLLTNPLSTVIDSATATQTASSYFDDLGVYRAETCVAIRFTGFTILAPSGDNNALSTTTNVGVILNSVNTSMAAFDFTCTNSLGLHRLRLDASPSASGQSNGIVALAPFDGGMSGVYITTDRNGAYGGAGSQTISFAGLS